MICIKNLTKVYRPKKSAEVVALDGVSIDFPDKGMVFVLGKSGCGKSTLLNILGGLDTFDSGEVYVEGINTGGFSAKEFDNYRNEYVGMVFQEFYLLEEITIFKNIGMALELQGKKPSLDAVGAALRQVELSGYERRKPSQLSGGQKQRVAIARALVKEPKIILADEPTGNLDSDTGEQIFLLLKELSKSKLIIVVSHDKDAAMRFGDRTIQLVDGKIAADSIFSNGGDYEKE